MKQRHNTFVILLGMVLFLLCISPVYAATTKPTQTITGDRRITITVDEIRSLDYKAQSKIRYTSSDPAILQVRSDQTIRGRKGGTAYLYVEALSSGTYTYTRLTVPVTVQRASQQVKITPIGSMGTGEHTTLSVSSRSSCRFSSSNSSIASINSEGVIVAKEPGTVTITVRAISTTKYLSASASIKITVFRKYVIIQINDGAKSSKRNYLVSYGNTFTFPSLEDHSSMTFVGWSTKANASLSQVNYYAGQKIAATKNQNFYSVFFKNSSLKSPLLPSLSSSYDRIIIVGDSRMYRTYLRLYHLGYFKRNRNVIFVAAEGEGLSWFENTAKSMILKQLSGAEGPTAIVLALGVNRIQMDDDYYTVYQDFASRVKKWNCRLFVTSVNPYNNAQIKSVGGFQRAEERLYVRNEILRRLPSYKYIDTCTYLRKNGYVYDSGYNFETGSSDGLHYNTNTYLHIFACIMNYVNKSA